MTHVTSSCWAGGGESEKRSSRPLSGEAHHSEVAHTPSVVARPGTLLRLICRARIRALAGAPGTREFVAGLLDGWMGGQSRALLADQVVQRTSSTVFKPGARAQKVPTCTLPSIGLRLVNVTRSAT
jgi:hypothetical protein